MNLPWTESPFFEEMLAQKKLSPQDEEIARTYNRDGFIVVPGLFSDDLIDQVRRDSEEAFDPSFPISSYRDTSRIQDLWQAKESSRTLACTPEVLRILEMLYGREVVPFQTLNFSVGTGQRAHSDTIHFSSLPARFMCGVWVALEDITPENGAVFYYPGSQRLPEYHFGHIATEPKDTSYADYPSYEDFIEKVVQQNGFEKKAFYAKKGDALIWSSNIIHGGSPVTKAGSSRWSQVTHYFFKNCIYYTPMLSNMVTNELYLRDNLVNMRNGKVEPMNYNGHTLHAYKTTEDKSILNNRFRFPYLMRFLKEKKKEPAK
jgi:hypothetical protein